MNIQRFLDNVDEFSSRFSCLFPHEEQMHPARFATWNDLRHLVTNRLNEEALILGQTPGGELVRIVPTPQRPHLGHMLIVGRSQSGKTLNLATQISNWPGPVIANDPKDGEVHALTGGIRAKRGRVIVFDPSSGLGNQFDPLRGQETEDKLFASAKHMLYGPNDLETIFTERAAKLLTLLFLTAKEINRKAGKEIYHLLPFVGYLVNFGLNTVAKKIHEISPWLAMRFLDGEYNPKKDYNNNRFLASCYEMLPSRLYPLLTENVVRSFDGSDFTAEEILTSTEPITVYLRWPETELAALSPVLRLMTTSLSNDLITVYKKAKQEGRAHKLWHLLIAMEEAGRTPVPLLYEQVATLAGRDMSIIAVVQSLSQIDAAFGKARAPLQPETPAPAPAAPDSGK